MPGLLRIRVLAKTDSEVFRVILSPYDGSWVRCDCDGFDGHFCSHIDAVLVARERSMVYEDDRKLADLLSDLLAGRLQPPQGWAASWRRNMRWRGLSTRKIRDKGKPIVCFTGQLRRSRSILLQEAELHGWETVNSPSASMSVLVAEDPMGGSAKLKAARKHGIPILTSDEWDVLLSENGNGRIADGSEQ